MHVFYFSSLDLNMLKMKGNSNVSHFVRNPEYTQARCVCLENLNTRIKIK